MKHEDAMIFERLREVGDMLHELRKQFGVKELTCSYKTEEDDEPVVITVF